MIAECQNTHPHHLVVTDPGSGQLSIESGTLLDRLESPIEALGFDELQDVPGGKEPTITGGAGQITVARLPVDGEQATPVDPTPDMGAAD